MLLTTEQQLIHLLLRQNSRRDHVVHWVHLQNHLELVQASVQYNSNLHHLQFLGKIAHHTCIKSTWMLQSSTDRETQQGIQEVVSVPCANCCWCCTTLLVSIRWIVSCSAKNTFCIQIKVRTSSFVLDYAWWDWAINFNILRLQIHFFTLGHTSLKQKHFNCCPNSCGFLILFLGKTPEHFLFNSSSPKHK